MTYNIRAARGMDGRLNLERIARVIEAEKPDVVALQEVDCYRKRTRHQHQAQELADLLGFHFAFEAARSWDTSEYGNALLSRYPLLESRGFYLPRPTRLPVENRCVMQCLLDTPSGPLSVWNTHLGLLARERKAQVDSLIEQIQQISDLPLVLCGDFNARPKAKELKGLEEILSRVPSQRTFPGILPVVHLDHVFYCPRLRVIQSFVARSTLARRASDHLPLVVDLAWSTAPSDSLALLEGVGAR